MIKCFFCSFFILFFLSCKDKPSQYFIKGRLINTCDNSPISEERVEANQVGYYGLLVRHKGFNKATTTNNNGDFEILYETARKADFSIFTLENVIPTENLDLGDIPYSSTYNVYYKIKVNNAYSSSDTLLIYDISSQNSYYKMQGPFHDTIIGLKTISKQNTLSYNKTSKLIEKTNSYFEIKAWYYINYKGLPVGKNNIIKINSCNSTIDTLTLYIN